MKSAQVDYSRRTPLPGMVCWSCQIIIPPRTGTLLMSEAKTAAPPATTSKRTADPGLWVDQHGDYLFKYASFRLRDAGLAEDAVQETLLAALQAYDKFEGRGAEGP